MPTTHCQLHPSLLVGAEVPTVSKGINGYQHMANVCLRSISAPLSRLQIQPYARPTYVDFRILEPFLQIVIYSLVRYFADECKI